MNKRLHFNGMLLAMLSEKVRNKCFKHFATFTIFYH